MSVNEWIFKNLLWKIICVYLFSIPAKDRGVVKVLELEILSVLSFFFFSFLFLVTWGSMSLRNGMSFYFPFTLLTFPGNYFWQDSQLWAIKNKWFMNYSDYSSCSFVTQHISTLTTLVTIESKYYQWLYCYVILTYYASDT